jgi:hypothetical protein
MGFASPDAANQDDIALVGNEAAVDMALCHVNQPGRPLIGRHGADDPLARLRSMYGVPQDLNPRPREIWKRFIHADDLTAPSSRPSKAKQRMMTIR